MMVLIGYGIFNVNRLMSWQVDQRLLPAKHQISEPE